MGLRARMITFSNFRGRAASMAVQYRRITPSQPARRELPLSRAAGSTAATTPEMRVIDRRLAGKTVARTLCCGLAGVVLTVASCGGSPSGPSPVVAPIRALRLNGPLLVAVGQRLPLRVVGLTGDGEETDLSSRTNWTVNGQAASLASPGEIVGQNGGTASLTGTTTTREGTALSLEAPVTVAERTEDLRSNAIGEWEGQNLVTACRALAVTAPGSCATIGLSSSWYLRLENRNRQAEGLMRTYIGSSGPVQGFTSSDGTLWLGGILRATEAKNALVVLYSRFSINGDALEGVLLIERSFRNFFGLIVQREEHQVTARRVGG